MTETFIDNLTVLAALRETEWQVYRNLSREYRSRLCYSLKERNGRVLFHYLPDSGTIIDRRPERRGNTHTGYYLGIDNPQFRVSYAGRNRVRKNRRKEVHAYIEGKIHEVGPQGWGEASTYRVTYNPYDCQHFELRVNVPGAALVTLDRDTWPWKHLSDTSHLITLARPATLFLDSKLRVQYDSNYDTPLARQA
jgi:hypothetical protein